VGFDKMFVFCGKFCVRSDKFVSIVIKIKCVNSSNVSDICNKLNVTTNYIHVTATDTYFIKIHTKITIFDIFDGTVPPRDLSISAKQHVMKDSRRGAHFPSPFAFLPTLFFFFFSQIPL
jgi:hypothetical protein